MIDSVFQKIPFDGDETENETVIKFTMKLIQTDQATCIKYMENIAKTCVKIIVDERCADGVEAKFKKEVGQFIKTIVAQHAQPILQAMEA